MHAIVMRGGKLQMTEVADPVPGRGQILVAPIFNGICGSDLHRREQMRGEEERYDGDPADLPAIIPGHEFSAEVISIGPETDTDIQPGDRVVALPFSPDPTGEGFINVGLSTARSGGLATRCIIDADRTFKIPDNVPSDVAALTEPLSVGWHAALLAGRNAGPNLILGAGPIGLAVLIALQEMGRGPNICVDFSSARRKMAQEFGADSVIDPNATSPYDSWQSFDFQPSPASPLAPRSFEGRPRGPNIFECTGSPTVLAEIVARAPRHSHVIYAGVCKHEVRHIPVDAILKELAIDYCFAYTPKEFETVLNLVATKPDFFRRMITSQFSLKNTETAFDCLSGSPAEVKILIDVQNPG
jgi:threonine dehydrogenase-like Zn-dependent dehydrogenase